MGSRLTAQAIRQRGISKPARLVLVQMAVMAKDADDPPRYFGGWEFLPACLGFAAYDASAKSAIARAVRELIDVGLIKPYGAAGPGHNVAYVLRI